MLTFANVIQPCDLCDEGIRHLALSLIRDAANCARAGDAAALAWLHSPDAELYADLAGFPAWPPVKHGVTLRKALRPKRPARAVA